jgi:hypothetical protein
VTVQGAVDCVRKGAAQDQPRGRIRQSSSRDEADGDHRGDHDPSGHEHHHQHCSCARDAEQEIWVGHRQ